MASATLGTSPAQGSRDHSRGASARRRPSESRARTFRVHQPSSSFVSHAHQSKPKQSNSDAADPQPKRRHQELFPASTVAHKHCSQQTLSPVSTVPSKLSPTNHQGPSDMRTSPATDCFANQASASSSRRRPAAMITSVRPIPTASGTAAPATPPGPHIPESEWPPLSRISMSPS